MSLVVVEATVTNRDSVAHTGVTLGLRLPEGLDPFNRALADGSFVSTSCSELGNSALIGTHVYRRFLSH